MPKDYGTPGPRAIYPDACTSRSLSSVSAEAERLFWRLISQADDQGRLEGDVLVLRSLCVPLLPKATTVAVERWLTELVGTKLILRYRIDDLELVQVVTWWRWQAGMRRAYASRWPAPEGWTDVVFGHGGDSPKTYRDAVGLPPGARTLPAASPQPVGSVPAASPQDARTLPAPPRAGLPAPAPAGAQPLPVPSAGASSRDTTPQPPASGGRRTRARDLGPMRSSTDYDEGLERDDLPWAASPQPEVVG